MDDDGDGIPNDADLDDVNFGHLGVPTPTTDSDNDGTPDIEDLDDDNDGILDSIEGDGDLDGIPNRLDLDSDNDGVNDVREGGLIDADFNEVIDGPDNDNDGMADDPGNDADGDGVPSSVDPDEGGVEATVPDSDNDGTPDFLDLDSDNDSVSDLVEGGSGGTDADNNGVIDQTSTNDSDGDGIMDSVDGATGAYGDSGDPLPTDTDSDGYYYDYRDLDSDDNGTPDITESSTPALDADSDGQIDTRDDADGDGIADPADADDALFGGLGIPVSTVSLPIKLFLQGAYDPTTDTMHDDLRTLTGANGFPQTSPYGGSETTSGAVLGNSDPNNAIVDWVNIELRDGGDNTSVVATVAALVQRDGDVVDASDGTSTLSLSGVTPGNYYVAVHHRNHLAAMTNSSVAVSGSTATVDFTTMTDAQTHGPNAQVLLETGVYGLWGGNVNDNDTILRTGAGNDLDPLVNTVLDDAGNVNDNTNYIVSGYYAGDLNMDGRVIAAGPNNDVTRVLSNIINHPANSGGNANHIVQEQLP